MSLNKNNEKKITNQGKAKGHYKSCSWWILALIILPGAAFADSGIRHVKCFNEPPSILSFFVTDESEFDVSIDLQIIQNDGKCAMKNKLGRTYLMDWMPAYHRVEIRDMDFGKIGTYKIMSPETTETIPFDLQREIPYCIEVTSVWLDNRVRTETSSETCFKL